ncbi:hypothetical protein BS47DRAFT_1299245 [Hydnum rufescens UP504]|uniref:ATP phosphoribosyltransferase n=1 Tax=Hydnum rufescens UP504 TaxID=1448309 RepID=A0A9P6ASZ5_9AGAM|nr:hypothetical protein BS47DRAFT_1299245 [Hydnum rufescens UP504]
MESIKDRLLFAIPKKGRLFETCNELLAGADFQFFRSNRLDVCLVQNHPIALVFLPASDIPRFVGEGNVDIGITGQDRIEESQMWPHVNEVLKLGFGKCKLQVQVPEHGTIQSVEDLAGKRVATSFSNIGGGYFREVDRRVGEERGMLVETKIEYVGGSVEAACALGLAEGIVDLVESGETMRAAGLHPIATVIPTEAVLITSKKRIAEGPKASFAPLIRLIISRLAGVVASRKFVLLAYNIPREKLVEASLVTPGQRSPTVSSLEETGWVAVNVMVERAKVAQVMDQLQEIGAVDLLVTKLENCRI